MCIEKYASDVKLNTSDVSQATSDVNWDASDVNLVDLEVKNSAPKSLNRILSFSHNSLYYSTFY